MTSPADRLLGKKPRQITVGVFLDESFNDAVDAAFLALREGRKLKLDADDIQALKEAHTEALAALDVETMWLTFRAMGRRAFARLLAEHPPTDVFIAECEAAGMERPQYDPDGFGPALIAAACINPVLTDDEVRVLYNAPGWTEAELGALFAAALAVNTRARPLGVKPGG